MRRSTLRFAAVSAAVIAVGGAALAVAAPTPPSTPATPGIACAAGSLPEQTQGRAPLADVATGRYAKGYTCNVAQIAHQGRSGGYRVERYVDAQGNECAYYDSTLLFPTSVPDQVPDGPGTYVLDMKDPARPVVTDVLRTPAFSSPHESVRLNHARGLLAAAFGTPATAPGQLEVYDVSKDCRRPALVSSTPFGVLGHEGGFAPDGKTFYVASLYFRTLTAIDLTDPRTPRPLWVSADEYEPHGVSISDDGRTLYMAEAAYDDAQGFSGLTVLDVSQVQARVADPEVPLVSQLTWDTVSTPQNATPFTSGGKKYVMEIDEFGGGAAIGAARIIDVQDITKPKVVSDIRLEVNRAERQEEIQEDPGSDQQFQGYQGHYCSLPSRVDPKILACSFIMSGLRVFDISDVTKPREIAYHNKPLVPGTSARPGKAGSFAMSAPAYDEATGDIWYSDGNSGFYVVRLTGPAKRAKFAGKTVFPGN